MKKSVALIWSLAATSMLFVPISAAYGADLVVLSAAATKTAVAGVPALVEATSGDHVRFVFGTAGAIRDLATAGDPFDVIIAPPPVLADLIANGLVLEGSRKPLGIVRLGAAFSKSGPRPAIDTPEALKSALLEARSIGMADPAKGATSGVYLNKLFSTLAIDQAMHAKLRLFPEGQTAMQAVAQAALRENGFESAP